MVLCNDVDVPKSISTGVYANTDPNNFKDLSWYLTTAERCIMKYAGSFATRMLRDEEAVAFVANHMMMGSCRYDAAITNGGGSLNGYLIQCAQWGIKRWKENSVKALTRMLNGDCREPDSLDHECGDDDEDSLSSKIADKQALEPFNILEMQDASTFDFNSMFVAAVLTDREIEALQLHYLEGLTASDISRQLEISRERVRQLLVKGIEKLVTFAKENEIEV